MRDFGRSKFEKRANGATKFAARQNRWGGERRLLAIGEVERQALCTQYLHFRYAFHRHPSPSLSLFFSSSLPLCYRLHFHGALVELCEIFRRDAMKLMTPENERRSKFSQIVFSHHVTAFSRRVFPETRSAQRNSSTALETQARMSGTISFFCLKSDTRLVPFVYRYVKPDEGNLILGLSR